MNRFKNPMILTEKYVTDTKFSRMFEVFIFWLTSCNIIIFSRTEKYLKEHL